MDERRQRLWLFGAFLAGAAMALPTSAALAEQESRGPVLAPGVTAALGLHPALVMRYYWQ